MEDEAPVIYGLEFQARSLTAQTAETDSIRFLVGTQSLRAENQMYEVHIAGLEHFFGVLVDFSNHKPCLLIHHIDFDDENNLISKNVFLHRDGEVWQIGASTFDKTLLSTCYNSTADSKAELRAAIWQLPENFDNSSMMDDQTNTHEALRLMCRLDTGQFGDIKGVLWQPTGESQTVVGVTECHVVQWDLDTASSTARMIGSTAVEGRGHPKLTCGRWNPHHNCSQIATANDTAIRGWDLRSMKQVYVIENAHAQLVRDLDFNPNKQYYLATCGDDCKVKFWDTRNTTEPLMVLAEHSHWVWAVRYNHFHDQLVLSSSSDSRVVLNNVVSLSSEPFGRLTEKDEDDSEEEDEDEERPSEPPKDGVIATYEEHEDSVYAVDWSTSDPWVFASLSYDGRLIINRVPRTEKYKILL